MITCKNIDSVPYMRAGKYKHKEQTMPDLKTCQELNKLYGNEFLEFSTEKGLTLFYRGRLKDFFEQEARWVGKKGDELAAALESILVKDSQEFKDNFGDFRDDVLGGSGSWQYCHSNDDLFPNHFGMTECPLISFEGNLWDQENDPVRYVFAYFRNYMTLDWVEVLREQGEVSFETFIDNSEAYLSFWRNYQEEA